MTLYQRLKGDSEVLQHSTFRHLACFVTLTLASCQKPAPGRAYSISYSPWLSFCVCLVCLVTHRILSAVSLKAGLLSGLLSVLNQPASFSVVLGLSCPRVPSRLSIRNDQKT